MFDLAHWMMESMYRSVYADTESLRHEDLVDKYGLPESRVVNIEDMPVHFTDSDKRRLDGKKVKTNKHPQHTIILLHGIYGSCHNWQACSTYWSNDYRVIALDLPNFGLTGPFPSNPSIQHKTYSHFLQSFMNELEISTCTLIGNSLGGYFTYRYAYDYPDRVNAIVLLDAAGFPFVPPMATLAWASPFFGLAAQNSNLPRSLMNHLVQLAYKDKSLATDTVLERYYELSLREGNRKGVANLMKFISTRVGFDHEILKSIACPALIIWGQEDEWIPVSHVHQFQQYLPQSQSVILENSGHMPMEETPDVFVQQVETFLSSL